MGALFSDDPKVESAGVAGGLVIMLSPCVFAKALTNVNAIRTLTKGLEVGPHSGRFAIALRKLAEMHVASGIVREQPTQDAVDFYTTIPQSSIP